MIIKKQPLFLVLFFNILGSGFFYSQEGSKTYQCPQGRHKGFICQCGPLKDSGLKLNIERFAADKYCPLGIHNFVCQCAPLHIYRKYEKDSILSKELPKK